MEAAMVSDEICSAILQWRFFTACPLLLAALTCNAKSPDATDESATGGSAPASSNWHYRDYLLYNAPPSATAFNNMSPVAQISIAEFRSHPNVDSGESTRKLLLSAGFDNRADWESIRYGLGLFANLPEEGQFHFNLYVRPNAQRPGFRWRLQPTGLPITADSGHQNWSIGGFVDYGRGRDGFHDRISVAPQLILNLSPLFHLPGDAQASVQYAYWRSTMDNDAPQNLALQMALRWRF
jgi:hypothetical protein